MFSCEGVGGGLRIDKSVFGLWWTDTPVYALMDPSNLSFTNKRLYRLLIILSDFFKGGGGGVWKTEIKCLGCKQDILDSRFMHNVII